ncbi:MAG: C10 family peptidase [Muribaculaceae bacterium]|nr:C10 family peptidase [Muribaculaceae bacterium]MDE5971897.1 C10 family peptidase [Muribaculaceae bacterium]
MKHLFPLTLLALSMISCESLDSPLEYADSTPSVSNNKRTEAEAVKLARKAASSTDQNSRAPQSYSISLITDNQSRSNELDTLCYIVNFDDEQGFALIAYDKRVSPVLAYSDHGNFTNDRSLNPAVYDCFIQKLPAFINNSIENASDAEPLNDPDFDVETCYSSTIPYNFLGRSWHQKNPYNQCVAKKYPDVQDIVVGCVPLAACQAMVFSKDTLTYHNIFYDLMYIRESLQDYDANYDQIEDMKKNPEAYADCADELNVIKTNYDISISYISKILEHLGDDLNAKYAPLATSASTKDAMILLRSLGYNISPASGTSLLAYNPTNVVTKIFQNNIVQIRANKAGSSEAHSWVIYSASYCRKENALPMPQSFTPLQKFMHDQYLNNIGNMYVYCEWGWKGDKNGLYNTDVFTSRNKENKNDDEDELTTEFNSNVQFYSVQRNSILSM